jgi:uncharacterized membrane protein YkoI
MLVDTRIIAFSAITLAGTAGLLATGPGSAGDVRNDPEAEVQESTAMPIEARPVDILSLQQILHNARQLHAGRVLEAELENSHGGVYYEVEILDASGEVWEMNFDARSGELLEEGQED